MSAGLLAGSDQNWPLAGTLGSMLDALTIRRWVLVGLLGVVVCPLGTNALAQVELEVGTRAEPLVLARGTDSETVCRIVTAAEDGPCVLIVGGMHGNEPAGAVAAGQIATWDIERGKLIVVPRANVPALEAGQRRTPGLGGDGGDLNRAFPLDGEVRDGVARELWALVERFEPDWVLDLHEGYDFHIENEESVGSSVIACDQERARALAGKVLAAVNETIVEPGQRFEQLETPVAGSLARAAWEKAGIPSMIIETTSKVHVLSYRVRQHRLAVHTLLRELGLGPSPAATVLGPNASREGLRIAVFDGRGVGQGAAAQMVKVLRRAGKCNVQRLDGHDIRARALGAFDVVVHPGGSGSGQAKALGVEGRRAETEFVRAGGGYLGVCAGAYLAACNYEWSLGLLDANVIDREHWRRGEGGVDVEWTGSGRALLAKDSSAALVERFEIEYANGPILEAARQPELEDFEVLLWFRGELAENGAPLGVMPGTPAVVGAAFGKGRAMAFSPHPEKTEGLYALLHNSLLWLAPREVEEE